MTERCTACGKPPANGVRLLLLVPKGESLEMARGAACSPKCLGKLVKGKPTVAKRGARLRARLKAKAAD